MRARLHRKPKQKKILKVVFLFVGIIVVGMLLPRLFSFVAATVMYPVQAIDQWFSESSSLIPVLVRDRNQLNQQIQDLENKVIVAERSDLTQRRLSEENNRLRNLLGASKETRIAAAVIARPDELPYDLLQIDVGSEDGVEVGAPVFIGQDIVIGLIVHVAPKYSFVEMVTTSGFEATAFISGPNVIATMEGFGGGVARVRVPQGVSLQVGNLVYLPSIEPGVFGYISHIENRPTQSEQYGYVSPEVPIHGLYQVSVGQQSQISRSVDTIDEHVSELMKQQLLVKEVEVTEVSTSTAEVELESDI